MAKAAKKKTTASKAKKAEAKKTKAKKARAKKARAKKKVVVFSAAEQRGAVGDGDETPRFAAWPCAGRSPSRSAATRAGLAPPVAVDWSVALGAPAGAPPVVADDGALYVPDREGRLFTLDVEAGDVLAVQRTDPIREVSPVWPLVADGHVPADRVPVSCAPAISRRLLLFGDDEGIFYCLRRGEGTVIWRKASPLTLAGRAGAAYRPPLAMDDRVYTADAEGNLYAASARSGRTEFSRFLRGRPAAAPVLAMFFRRLLVTTRPLIPGEPPLLHCLDAERGDRAWKVELPGAPTRALAATRELVLVGTTRGLAAYGLVAGERRWDLPLEGGATGGLAVAGDRVFAPSGRDVVAVAVADGAELWRRPTGERTAELLPAGDLACGGDVVWAPARRSLLALSAERGTVLAKPRVPGAPVGGPVLAADRVLVATDTGEVRAFVAEG